MNENNKIETHYLDDDNNIVESEKATKCIIRELDEKGNLVSETCGTFSNEKEMTDEEFDDYMVNLFAKEAEYD